jgi:hypothetical protein
MIASSVEILGVALYAAAVLHTFCIKRFQHYALKFSRGSMGENLFHLLGEVEIVFGLWAGVLGICMALMLGSRRAVEYIDQRNFTEAVFVFAVMTIAATRPVLEFAEGIIGAVSKIVPLPGELRFYLVTLVVGPLLGSLITEPAAMTVTALILKDRFFSRGLSDRFMYLTLAVLFVNVSIGGASPPLPHRRC